VGFIQDLKALIEQLSTAFAEQRSFNLQISKKLAQ